MIRRIHIKILFILLSSLLFVSCAQRYSKIPRVHFQKKTNTYSSNGHYVNAAREQNKPQLHSTNHAVIDSTKSQETKAKTVKPKPGYRIRKRSTQITTDSTSNNEVDKNLISGSGALFTIAAGINAALLITPLHNFLFVGLLLGLGVLVLGYFISKFIENTNQNRLRSNRYKLGQPKNRDQLKKAFNISMIVSGVSFALALMTAATGSIALPYTFFILGMITLWVGLLVGIVYLVMGV